jgi:cell cycle checkpoint protein
VASALVRFNPIATTIMKPGLKRVVNHALSTPGDSRTDDSHSPVKAKAKGKGKAKAEDKDDDLRRIGTMLCDEVSKHSDGDMRSAINALQMALRMAVSGSGDVKLEDLTAASSSKRQKLSATKSAAKNEVTLSAHVARLMSLVTERESSLALWHAIGKVLYNKRAGEENDEAERQMMRELADRMGPDDPPLPSHFAHLKRRLSMVDVEGIWSQISCEPSSFQLFLHHNYPQFCEEIDESADIMEQYSYADSQLHPAHEGWQSAALSSYYGFLVSTRGTLLHLPSPVPRRGQVLKNAHFWQVGKQSRKFVEGLLDAQTFLLNKARPKSAASSGVDACTAAADLKTFSSSSMSELAVEIVPMLSKIKSLDGEFPFIP